MPARNLVNFYKNYLEKATTPFFCKYLTFIKLSSNKFVLFSLKLALFFPSQDKKRKKTHVKKVKVEKVNH